MPNQEDTAKERVVLKIVKSLDDAERLFYILKAYLEGGDQPEVEIWLPTKEEKSDTSSSLLEMLSVEDD